MKRSSMFARYYATLLSTKKRFYETTNVLYSSTARVLTKLLAVSTRLVKIKVTSHWTFSVILLISAVLANKLFTWKRDCVIFLKLQIL